MLLTHLIVSPDVVELLFHLESVMHVLFLLFFLDLFQKVSLQLCVLLLPIEVVSLQVVINSIVSLLHVPLEHIIQTLVVGLMELGQIWLVVLYALGVLLGNLFLTCHIEMHPLHVVILVLHEWRHPGVQVPDLTALVLIVEDLARFSVVKILGFWLV